MHPLEGVATHPCTQDDSSDETATNTAHRSLIETLISHKGLQEARKLKVRVSE